MFESTVPHFSTLSAHTPGPWTCKVGVMGPYVDKATKTIQPHYVLNQTESYSCPTITQDEAWANARLIAAAPELLKLARLVVDYFGDDELDPLLDADIRLRDMARTIVATVEGRCA